MASRRACPYLFCMKLTLLFFILQLIAATTFCQEKNTMSAESARQDLTLLYKSLIDRHPGVYRHVTPAELKGRYDEVLATVNRTLSSWEFYRAASRLTAAVKCGHTRLGLPENLRNDFTANGKFFPLPILFADTTMYARWPDQSVKQVISINGKKIHVIMRTIFKNISEDGNSIKSKYDLAEVAFALLYARHIELYPPTFRIEFTSTTKTLQTQSIAPVTWDKSQLSSFYERKDFKPATFNMMGDTGYLYIATFDSESFRLAGINFNDFLQSTFAELKKNKIQKLIVDIRRNGGGSDQYGANMCSYLTGKPFSYFKTVKQKSGDGYSPVSHPCLSVQSPASNAFTGKICLLIDGLTFSTAADVASVTWANHFARVIGRETGGGYDGNTSGRSESVLLTNSGITLTIPLWYYENAVPPARELHRGVLPDVLINRTHESIVQHRDLEVETAMKWLSGGN